MTMQNDDQPEFGPQPNQKYRFRKSTPVNQRLEEPVPEDEYVIGDPIPLDQDDD